MVQIEVGKFTLESLTTGMYTDPEIVYREYIQNSVDAIDEAVELGLISSVDAKIEILVDQFNGSISIRDNGCGISTVKAPKVLLDIGNSQKRHSKNRGFRGIGRLGGLSYCKKLIFTTSVKGEDVKTIISFDCNKLKKLLVPGQHENYNLQQVISAITSVTSLAENRDLHFFEVKLEGIDEISNLLDYDSVKEYISQVAPLPYAKEFIEVQ